ncbi:molybdopterin dehydrogenase [Alsobacter metallidurans]|uniref:Molybdopterin dehydrogenase n=1 Tax=Alsobacter metallidurans TaxID=340221 RepID=A0A917I9Z1_9HYPH|nr:FAD binding domain-containing protein [Alsobacter metallidurans]GGH24137.1 molybdopterin dehydrogenase [Alsobacter metallidurans]
MKAPPFTYHRPTTGEELAALLGSLENAKVLAGGQSLMPMLNLRLAFPDHLIDINRVEGLAGIKVEGEDVVVGAMTRQADVLASSVVAERLPVLAEALRHVGHIQTRSRGTYGGSCCHLDPSSEQPAMAALYDARFHVVGAAGRRTVEAADWSVGMLQSALADDEYLEAIRFTPWRDGADGRCGYGFAEYARRHGDYAIVGCAALVRVDQAGAIGRAAVVLFGVEPSPTRLPALEAASLGQAAAGFNPASHLGEVDALDVMEDIHVNAVYRRRLARVMIGRAFADALARATGAKA